jgi:hypothetical protein
MGFVQLARRTLCKNGKEVSLVSLDYVNLQNWSVVRVVRGGPR